MTIPSTGVEEYASALPDGTFAGDNSEKGGPTSRVVVLFTLKDGQLIPVPRVAVSTRTPRQGSDAYPSGRDLSDR